MSQASHGTDARGKATFNLIKNQFNLMIYPTFELDFIVLALSYLVTELTSRKLHSCYLVINEKRRVKLHHAYLGALLALIASLFGQMVLLNVGLGTMLNDLFGHLKKFIKNRSR
jgi:uncharacterized BrkB/YihY/UPF0761 family membrane protein